MQHRCCRLPFRDGNYCRRSPKCRRIDTKSATDLTTGILVKIFIKYAQCRPNLHPLVHIFLLGMISIISQVWMQIRFRPLFLWSIPEQLSLFFSFLDVLASSPVQSSISSHHTKPPQPIASPLTEPNCSFYIKYTHLLLSLPRDTSTLHPFFRVAYCTGNSLVILERKQGPLNSLPRPPIG